MKRDLGLSLLLVLVMVLSALLLPATAVQASVVVGDQLWFVGYNENGAAVNGITSWSQGSGGEFVFADGSTKGTSFVTFCCQINENIYIPLPTGPYNVSALTTNTTSSGDYHKVSDFAKWLAYNVYTGAIKVNSNSMAGEIQYAIWNEEGYSASTIETELGISDLTAYNSAVYAKGGLQDSFTADNNAATEAALVDVAQLDNYPSPGDQNQDQLVLVLGSEGNGVGPLVPEPATIVIWGVGAGLAGAAALRRRKEPKGRWSEENRQAIFEIIGGKR